MIINFYGDVVDGCRDEFVFTNIEGLSVERTEKGIFTSVRIGGNGSASMTMDIPINVDEYENVSTQQYIDDIVMGISKILYNKFKDLRCGFGNSKKLVYTDVNNLYYYLIVDSDVVQCLNDLRKELN